VIIVENGRKGNTESVVMDYIQKLPVQYEYVVQPNKNNALNYALKNLPNCLVMFTDDDVRFHPETLLTYEKGSKNTNQTTGELILITNKNQRNG
jgi:hypothetical protein